MMTRALSEATAAEEPTCPRCGRYCLPYTRCPACGCTPAAGVSLPFYDNAMPFGEAGSTGLVLGTALRRVLDKLRRHRT